MIEGNEAAVVRYKILIRDLESRNTCPCQMISAISTNKQTTDDNDREKLEIWIKR